MSVRSLIFIALAMFCSPVCAQTSMYTSSNSGTASAGHAVVAVSGMGHKFFSAICTGNSAFAGGYCMVLDAAAQPADGAVVACTPGSQTSTCVKFCVAIPPGPAAAQGVSVAGGSMAPTFNNGIVVVISTGANCSTLTTSDGASVFESTTYN